MFSQTTNRRLQIESLENRQMLATDFVISEFLASNDNDVRDNDYHRTDWVEILNVSGQTKSLDGWFLTDDAGDLNKWRIPDVVLDIDKRVLVRASGENRGDPNHTLHANFVLHAEGEYLALVQPDGKTVEFDFGSQFLPQMTDVSFGLPQPVQDSDVVGIRAPLRVLIPTPENGGDQLGQTWAVPSFDDSTWTEGESGVGYERNRGYEDLIGADVEAEMFDVNRTAFVRLPFSIDDPSKVFALSLSAQYDDGYVAYLNGIEIVRRNAPDDLTWDSGSLSARRDSESIRFEDVDLSPYVDMLRTGENLLAIHALNDNTRSADFLLVPKLNVSTFLPVDVDSRHYFPLPSAGQPNGIGVTTSLTDVTAPPPMLEGGKELIVNATVQSTTDDVPQVMLYYRAMYDPEVSVAMLDDGLNGDGEANDGIFGAAIPAGIATNRQMIRYRVATSEEDVTQIQVPLARNELEWQQYLGTAVQNGPVPSELPVLQLYVEDIDLADDASGTYGVLYFDGEFYDNIFIDVHGFTTRGYPKKSHDIFFPRDHRFRLTDQAPRYKDINILTNWGDPTLMRNVLSYDTFRLAGVPSHLAFPMRVENNGEFFGIFDFIEDGDDEFLDRTGLDPRGALYKMDNHLLASPNSFEKKTRTNEDFSDLEALVDGVGLTGDELKAYLFDNIDIPGMISHATGLAITGESDCCRRNYYAYRDTEGTGEWQYFPWDVDKSLGRQGTFNIDQIRIDIGQPFSGGNNRLIEALFKIPEIRSMYLRRLRTMMDLRLGAPGAEPLPTHFDQQVTRMTDLLEEDIPAEFVHWERGNFDTWVAAVDRFRTEYLAPRKEFLYNALTATNGGVELAPQVGFPELQFGEIEAHPASGNQDEEYIQLTNPLTDAVDISGWQINGIVQFTFAPGTALAPGGSLYLTPDVNTFRARNQGPSGGQGLFVLGGYTGHLSQLGGTVELTSPDENVLVASQTLAPMESDVRDSLRISELMYHPMPQPDSPFDDEQFEFIELVNTSETNAIQLQGASIAEGVRFTFSADVLQPGERIVVARDELAFRQRYGEGVRIAGQYGDSPEEFKLSNGGEGISLLDADDAVIQQFVYQDTWYPATDGEEASLEVVDPTANLDQWNVPSGWRASQLVNGTPGFAGQARGDFDGGGGVDSLDIDALFAEIRAAENSPVFDLTADGIVDQADVDELVRNVLRTEVGDTNLDGVIDQADFANLAASFGSNSSGWAAGDLDGNGQINFSDFVALSNFFGFGEKK